MRDRIKESDTSECCKALAYETLPVVEKNFEEVMVSWNTEEDTITFEDHSQGPYRSITVEGDCGK